MTLTRNLYRYNMSYRILKTGWAVLFILTAVILQTNAQSEIQREVRVVKPYTPTLSDAEKINLLPDMKDTVKVKPDFNYSIRPKQFNTPYNVEQIKPARMVGLPLEKLYKSQLTIGFGNYLTPLAELSVNQLRSRKSASGLYLKHHSSGGEVTLANDEKMYSGFSDNEAEAYGKWFLKDGVIQGSLSGGYHNIHHYGYNTDIDTIPEKNDILQSIISAGAKLKYYSSHIDSSRLNHASGIGYEFTRDRFGNMQNAFSINTDLKKKIGDQNIGALVSLDHYQVSPSIDSSANTLIRVNPFVSKSGDEWMFLLGFNTTADVKGDNAEFKIYPKAAFEFHIVKDVLTPYLGVDGRREENHYRKILFENPYIVPGLSVNNSNYSLIAHAGIRGRYSSRMAFNFKASYSIIENMYFFINDTSNILANQFINQYDDVLLTTFTGEISWNQSEKLKFLLKGWYHHYELDNLEYPWHKPELEILFGTSYNLRDKILINSNVFFTGKRYALSASPPNSPMQLNAYLDANMKVEYRYTKLLSFFLQFNNFTASRYQIWNQYPVQRFQVMGGFSYAL